MDERSKWQRFIGDGKNHDEDTARRLRAVVASTTLRRTKDMTDSKGQRIVKLPGISYYVHKVKLHKDARELYNLVATKVFEHTEKLEKQRRDRERVQDLRKCGGVVDGSLKPSSIRFAKGAWTDSQCFMARF